MKKFLNKTFSIVVLSLTLIITPLQGFAFDNANFSSTLLIAQQKIINYEKSQPSAIDNPVVDPNFNVMRTNDMESSSTATYIVIGLLVIASIVPIATWYFSKSRTN